MKHQEIDIESVICQALDHACVCGWDSPKQTELAVRVVRRLRPNWSDLEARCAVEWTRRHAVGELRAV